MLTARQAKRGGNALHMDVDKTRVCEHLFEQPRLYPTDELPRQVQPAHAYRANSGCANDRLPVAEINMRIAVRRGHPLLALPKVCLTDLVGASWLYMTAHDSSDDIVSRSFIGAGLPVPLPAVHCGSYFIALDLIAATDMIGVLPPALLRSCMKSGQLDELLLAQPLLPIYLGLYTRAGSPATASANAAADAIVAIAHRIAMTGKLRRTKPLVA